MKTIRPSIVQAIFLLVFATLAVATAVTFAITFRGPPPRPAPVAVEAVAAVLRGQKVPERPMRRPRPGGNRHGPGGPPFPNHGFGPGGRDDWPSPPALASTPVGEPFAPRRGERADPERDRLVEAALGATPSSVTGAYDEFGPRSRGDLFGGFTIQWRAPDGIRSVQTAAQPLVSRWHLVTGATMLAAFLILLLPAWLLARRISRPLQRLAEAANAARLGGDFPIPRGGPREVGELAEAVGAMQARIAGEAEGRTNMLAAIAHDLGTPLSRIAFWIEQLPDTARDRAAADIEEMRAMLGEVLRFARDQRLVERTRVELGSVIDSLVDDLAVAGQPVSAVPGPRAVVAGDPAALRRLFANLIENAIRYGDKARVGWTNSAGIVTVTVADDGPGFDADLAERAFEPFVRGDPSRNRATGGSGLGLAIVRTLTEAHGGAVTLGRGASGGGLVTVTLPLV